MNENYIFENALEDICWDCGRKEYCCKFDKDCPFFDDISNLEMECEKILEVINGIAVSAKKLKPEYDSHSDFEFMPERDPSYWIGSRAMHF